MILNEVYDGTEVILDGHVLHRIAQVTLPAAIPGRCNALRTGPVTGDWRLDAGARGVCLSVESHCRISCTLFSMILIGLLVVLDMMTIVILPIEYRSLLDPVNIRHEHTTGYTIC